MGNGRNTVSASKDGQIAIPPNVVTCKSGPASADLPNSSDKPVKSEDVLDLELPLFGPSAEEIKAQAQTEAQRTKRITQKQEEIRQWVATALERIIELEKMKKAIPLGNTKIGEELKKLHQQLQTLLGHAAKEVRIAAKTAYLLFHFSNLSLSFVAVEKMLERLTEKGFLIQDKNGVFRLSPRKTGYQLSDDFGERELTELKISFGQLMKKVASQEQEAKIRAIEVLKQQATPGLSYKNLLDGVPGVYLFGVPPEKYTDRNGVEKWRGGGQLLVKSDGQKIDPLSAVGTIAVTVNEAIALKVFLLLKTLSWDQAPFIRDLDPDCAKKVALLWYLLKRGVRAAEAVEAVKVEKTEMAKKANLSPKEFFNDGQGVVYLELQNVWETSEGTNVPNVYFLLERREEGDVAVLQLKEVPKHLAKFLENCLDVYAEGPRFNGVPYPLGAILQALYGQTMYGSNHGNGNGGNKTVNNGQTK